MRRANALRNVAGNTRFRNLPPSQRVRRGGLAWQVTPTVRLTRGAPGGIPPTLPIPEENEFSNVGNSFDPNPKPKSTAAVLNKNENSGLGSLFEVPLPKKRVTFSNKNEVFTIPARTKPDNLGEAPAAAVVTPPNFGSLGPPKPLIKQNGKDYYPRGVLKWLGVPRAHLYGPAEDNGSGLYMYHKTRGLVKGFGPWTIQGDTLVWTGKKRVIPTTEAQAATLGAMTGSKPSIAGSVSIANKLAQAFVDGLKMTASPKTQLKFERELNVKATGKIPISKIANTIAQAFYNAKKIPTTSTKAPTTSVVQGIINSVAKQGSVPLTSKTVKLPASANKIAQAIINSIPKPTVRIPITRSNARRLPAIIPLSSALVTVPQMAPVSTASTSRNQFNSLVWKLMGKNVKGLPKKRVLFLIHPNKNPNKRNIAGLLTQLATQTNNNKLQTVVISNNNWNALSELSGSSINSFRTASSGGSFRTASSNNRVNLLSRYLSNLETANKPAIESLTREIAVQTNFPVVQLQLVIREAVNAAKNEPTPEAKKEKIEQILKEKIIKPRWKPFNSLKRVFNRVYPPAGAPQQPGTPFKPFNSLRRVFNRGSYPRTGAYPPARAPQQPSAPFKPFNSLRHVFNRGSYPKSNEQRRAEAAAAAAAAQEKANKVEANRAAAAEAKAAAEKAAAERTAARAKTKAERNAARDQAAAAAAALAKARAEKAAANKATAKAAAEKAAANRAAKAAANKAAAEAKAAGRPPSAPLKLNQGTKNRLTNSAKNETSRKTYTNSLGSKSNAELLNEAILLFNPELNSVENIKILRDEMKAKIRLKIKLLGTNPNFNQNSMRRLAAFGNINNANIKANVQYYMNKQKQANKAETASMSVRPYRSRVGGNIWNAMYYGNLEARRARGGTVRPSRLGESNLNRGRYLSGLPPGLGGPSGMPPGFLPGPGGPSGLPPGFPSGPGGPPGLPPSGPGGPPPPGPGSALNNLKRRLGLTPAENQVVSSVGDIQRVNRIFKEAGGPSKVSEAIAVLKTYPRNKAVSMRLVSSAAANAVTKLGGPNRAIIAVAVNEKIVQARKRTKSAKKAKAPPPPQIKVKLLKTLATKLTKNELVKIAGKNALKLKGTPTKKNTLNRFMKLVRHQPMTKKRGYVHGAQRKKTKK